MEVLILSAQKQPLGLLVEALIEAGLKPGALDLTPVAAQRAENRSQKIQSAAENISLSLLMTGART